jgi:hypothetical protein
MATWYWDYDRSITSDSTSTSSTTSSFGSNNGRRYYYYVGGTSTTTGSCTGAGTYWHVEIQRILVRAPEHWTEEQTAKFVRLVNDETKTGWKVEMVLTGDIRITDPNIQIRDMDGFKPLFKQGASADDRQKIDAFYAEHVENPPAA